MPNRRNQRGTFKNTDKHPARRHDSPQDDSISQVVLYDKNSTRKTGDPYSYSESYQDSSVTVPDERWLAGRKREKYRGGDHRPLERPLITGATSDDLDSSNSYSYESSRDRGRQVKVVTSPGRKTEIPMAKMRQKHERHKDYHRRLTESALAQHRNKHGYPSGRYPRNDVKKLEKIDEWAKDQARERYRLPYYPETLARQRSNENLIKNIKTGQLELIRETQSWQNEYMLSKYDLIFCAKKLLRGEVDFTNEFSLNSKESAVVEKTQLEARGLPFDALIEKLHIIDIDKGEI